MFFFGVLGEGVQCGVFLDHTFFVPCRLFFLRNRFNHTLFCLFVFSGGNIYQRKCIVCPDNTAFGLGAIFTNE